MRTEDGDAKLSRRFLLGVAGEGGSSGGGGEGILFRPGLGDLDRLGNASMLICDWCAR